MRLERPLDREKVPDSSMYGSADKPSNRTGVNGEAPGLDGGTGCTFAAIDRHGLGLAARLRVCVEHVRRPEQQTGVLVDLLDLVWAGHRLALLHTLRQQSGCPGSLLRV